MKTLIDLRDCAALIGLGLIGGGLYYVIPLAWLAIAAGAVTIAAAFGWTKRRDG